MNRQPLPAKIFGFTSQPSILFGLVILVAIACAVVAYQRINIPTQNQHQTSAATSEQLINSGLSSAEIIAMDMFGSTVIEAQDVVDHQSIPETNLKLLLKGAFSHRDPKHASALIASAKNRRAELYFIDAELPGNAILKEVHPNYVVLSRAGRLEKLLFFRDQGLTDQSRDTLYRSQPQSSYTQIPVNNNSPVEYVQPPYSGPESSTGSGFSPTSLKDVRDMLQRRAEQQ